MYKPTRDYRFEYIWDAMAFIEDNQCRTCAFGKLNDPDENKNHAFEYPMCYEIEGEFITEEPVEAIDDCGDEGLVCTKYRSAELANQEPGQGVLFDD